jgi:1-acyl-sn-glycerol-3-phosphate acyltransferase
VNTLRRWLSLGFFFAFQLGFVRPMLRWYWGARYRRRGALPSGPCIVVANHNSHLDAPLLMTMFPIRRLTQIHPVAAADYFGKTAWRRTIVMIGMNAMGIERTAAAGRDVLQPMVDALEAGKTLIFFPEGSRGEPGVIGSFKPGIGKIAKTVPGLVVLPVFLAGAERSLPRGESVPLPLGIDVIVGKPKTYDSSLDAREIAEMVRADVLALAPSRPSPPGPRPQPPVRVACCGIDQEANRALAEAIGRRLGAPHVEGSNGSQPAKPRLLPKALAWAFRASRGDRGKKFAEMIERARIDEARADGSTPRFVVADGSPLVDLLAAAEADFYSGSFDEKGLQQILLYVSGARRIPWGQWPKFLRKAPEVWLLNVFDLAQPPAPDVLVLVSRGSVSESERLLQEGYQQVAGVLRKRRIDVVELQADSLDVETAAAAVETVSRRLASKGTEAALGG